ncbi:MAG: dTDP-4-dehydrorhamnose 3,5-epimerase [Clostridia bacterium]|nr:dTDP-4-dehydrorhamnose 3,5-epimerase [Clostridia bacterium]
MGKFNFIKTDIKDLILVEPTVFGDSRGYFMETYQKEEFKQGGIDVDFVQDNQSCSGKGVLRGMHFQKKNPQGKLVRVVSGAVYDVAVDLRKDSKTYGKWQGFVLSAENKRQLYVPEGFAHGFLVLSDSAEFVYKCTRYYDGSDEGGLMYNDPDLNIDWHAHYDGEFVISDKDKKHPLFKDLKD